MNINALLESLALVLLNTPNKQSEVTKQLRYVLAHTANKEFPNSTDSHLASLTDMNRGVVRAFLDQGPPRQLASKESQILSECYKNSKSNLLNLHGENSFYSIVKKYNLDYSATSVLNNLIRLECVEFFNETSIKVLSPSLIIVNDKEESIRILCKSIHRLTKTVLHNMQNEEKKYQRAYITNSVPKNKIIKLHYKLSKHLKDNVMPQIQEIINRYEDDNNNYPEYSISVFENF